jgi:hypothetical protein
VQIGCNTGIITEISHFGVLMDSTEGEQESRCYTKWDDLEHQGCMNFSKKDSVFFKSRLEPCIGQKGCFLTNLNQSVSSVVDLKTCPVENDMNFYVQW